MLEAKDQAVALYEGMEAERARYVAKEKEYEDKLNKMDVELDTRLSIEIRLGEEIEVLKAWEKRLVNRRRSRRTKMKQRELGWKRRELRSRRLLKRLKRPT